MAAPTKKRIDRVRNIGVIAHIDAGKTTVSERFLFYSGKIHKIGNVDKGETQLDWMPEERERGITITAAATSFEWNQHEIHLIDTPGHVDFTIEVERSLRVLDGAVVVFSAVDGVEPQSETVWHQANKFHVPRLAFVNKMDRIGANFDAVLEDIRSRLSANPVAIQIPIGAEDHFEGMLDLIHLRRITFTGEEEDPPQIEELVGQERQQAVEAREQLVEHVANVDDTFAELYLSLQTIDAGTLETAIRRATLAGKMVPVLCGSALRNRGVQPLLDAVVAFLPSPINIPAIEGIHPQTGKAETRPADDKVPFCGLAFKVVMLEGRKAVYVRIYSGTLQEGDDVFNPRLGPAGKDAAEAKNIPRGRSEKISRLFVTHADRRERCERAGAGSIVLVVGLKDTATGDTLCAPTAPILLERIDAYEPVISQALEANNSGDLEKLKQALAKMADEDPTFHVREDEDTGQTIVSGMGELHLEIIHDRLKREYHVPTRIGRPQVVYQETVLGQGEGQHVFERITDQDVIFGSVHVRVFPMTRGQGCKVRSNVPALPANTPTALQRMMPSCIEAALAGIQDAMGSGPKGNRLVDVEAVLVGVEPRVEASSNVGWRIAGARAFLKACEAAGSALLEPIMSLEVVVPDAFVGNVLGDLNQRHAHILDVGIRGNQKLVIAQLPMRALFGYATAVRSSTEGRAHFSIKFNRYDTWS